MQWHGWPHKTCPFYTCVIMPTSVFLGQTVWALGFPNIIQVHALGPCPMEWACLTHYKTRPFHIGYYAEFYRCWSNSTSVYGDPSEKQILTSGHLRSLIGHPNWHGSIGYDFRLTFHNNRGHKLLQFSSYVENANFSDICLFMFIYLPLYV